MNIFRIYFRKFTSTPWWNRYSGETDSCEAGWEFWLAGGLLGGHSPEGSGWEGGAAAFSPHIALCCAETVAQKTMSQPSWTHPSASTTLPNPHIYPGLHSLTQVCKTRRDLMTPDHLGTQHQITLSSRLAFYAPVSFQVARQASRGSAVLSLPIGPSFLFDLEFLHDLLDQQTCTLYFQTDCHESREFFLTLDSQDPFPSY